jgi:hypothetical protein
MAAGWTTAELASEPWQIGHGTPTVRIRVGLSHSFCETRTGGVGALLLGLNPPVSTLLSPGAICIQLDAAIYS